MSEDPLTYGENGATRRTRDAHRAALKAARTKRLKRRFQPFDQIDQEVRDLLERITPPDGEVIEPAVARVILSAQTLRKELLLGRLRAEELDRKIEEADVMEEFERLKEVLEDHGIYP